jgi:hypothetical protein
MTNLEALMSTFEESSAYFVTGVLRRIAVYIWHNFLATIAQLSHDL